MTAKVGLGVIGGLIMAVAASWVWADVPDSWLNREIDAARARTAHGRLIAVSDSEPLGDRYPIVAVLGMNGATDEEGPSETELKQMVNGILPDTAGVYQEWRSGREFSRDVKVYGYWYNSNFSPKQVATWVDALVENHPELSQQRVRFSTWGHSMGGNVMFCYWYQTGNRRLDAKVTVGTPHNGALMADPVRTNQAIDAAYPKLIAGMAKQQAAKRNVDFNAPGLQWLRLDYPPMVALKKQHPLDASWTVIAGITTPSKRGLGSYIDLLVWLDRAWLEHGQDQDFKAYQAGAYVLQEGGIANGSDGVVGVDSALCQGFAGNAHVVTLSEHNHSQMWWGNGGMELARERLRPVMPYIIAHQQSSQSPFANGFDIWLPQLPQLDLPKNQTADLKDSQLAWIDHGTVMVSNETTVDPVALQLGEGNFSWPQWSGDDLVAAWQHGDKSDVVMVSADTGRMVQLTSDGTSGCAGAQDDGPMVAFTSRDLMIMDSTRGLARALVCGPITLVSPPVFIGQRLYFAMVGANGEAEIRWVNPALKDRTLNQTALVSSVSTRPMKFGAVALAMKGKGDDAELVLISPWWTGHCPLGRQLESAVKALRGIGMPEIASVDISNATGEVYTDCTDGQICRIDLGVVAESFSQAGAEIGSWQEVARPLLITGEQLDVK